jgi:GT2 family glycosyltransferase
VSERAVTAVIVVHNELDDLRRCVEALDSQTTGPSDVVIVDNGSTDGSLEWATGQVRDGWQVVPTGADLGFCAAANIGFRASTTPYVLNVSPDVRLAPDYVELCLAVLESEHDVGICAGKLLRSAAEGVPVEPPTFDTTGHVPHRDGTVSERGHGEHDVGQFDTEQEVFGVTAAAALFRRELVEEIAYNDMLFDETFWGYKDDIDVCWRAWRFGWRVRYVPRAVAYHRRGFAVAGADIRRRRSIPLELRRHSFSNRYLVLVHNARALDIMRNLLHLLWYELRAVGWIILREREMLGAYVLLWKKIPHAVALRRDAKQRRRSTSDPWRRFTP